MAKKVLPTLMNCVPMVGGSMKLLTTPGGGGRVGIVAAMASGSPGITLIVQDATLVKKRTSALPNFRRTLNIEISAQDSCVFV